MRNIEVEGAGHRDILEKTGCLVTCISEACSTPKQYLELIVENVSYRPPMSCFSCFYRCCLCPLYCLCNVFLGVGGDVVFVELKWRGVSFTTEPLKAECGGGARQVHEKRRFVFGVTQEDFDKDHCIELTLNNAIQENVATGGQASGTIAKLVKISELFKQKRSDGLQTVKIGESGSSHHIKWRWRWGSATDDGKPNFS